MSDLHWMTATEAGQAITARKLSPVELMKALLERIARLDPRLNVFIRFDGDAAMMRPRPPRLRSPRAACAGRCMVCR